MNFYETLLVRVRQVRRKWRMQALIKGISLFLVFAIALLVLGVWGADLFGFKAVAVWIMRLLTGGAVLYVALRFLYLPWRRRITEVQVAQYIEERYPQLEDRLVTAVEYGQKSQISPGILDLLIKDALEKTSRIDFAVFLNHKRLATHASVGLVALVLLIALLNWGPSFFPYGFKRLYVQWSEASVNTPLLVLVSPGTLEVAKGSDLEVKAQLVGFDSPDVTLYLQQETSTAWAPITMEPEPRGSAFRYLLLDMQSSLRYYVESKGVHSQTYTLKVVDLPRVDRIDLTYQYPAYSGMAPQTVEDAGDISALKGTEVGFKVQLSQDARSARLLFDDQSTLALSPSGDKTFTGTLALRRSGSYIVQLVSSTGRPYPGSSEYQIEVLQDAAPKVTITKPLRDLRATSVEEVFSEIKAEDDVGVGKVELHFSVNGDPEKVVNLFDGKPKPLPDVTSTHTFFLEEFGLQPGDVISYFGKAADNNNVTGPGSSSSDIYFIEIRPFEQKYIQSQAAPGAGGGQGGQEALSRQQKEIISATFKLIRDKEKMDPKEYADDLKSLALVQSRLRATAQGLVDRLIRRGAGEVNQDFGKLSEYLKTAIAEMEKAAIHLGEQKPIDALPEEQKALQQLMRAESLFREIQVSLGNASSGGGGQANAEDLADLFELELNKLKNQYETVQRGEQQARDQQIDEALQRLKELAQRQQQLNERSRLMGQRGSTASSGGGGQSQQQLVEEAQRLQRQLERLSRERSSPEMNRASSQLQQAIQEMKRATERSLRGNDQEATAQGIRALQQLEASRRALSQGQDTRLNQEVEQAAEESRRILEEQKRIQSGVARLVEEKDQSGKPEFQGHRKDLSERKAMLAEELRELGDRIDDLARRSRKTQKETSSKLNDASGTIRDKKLPERILQGNQLLDSGYYDYMKAREEFVRSNLEELNKQMEAARNSLGQTREGKLEDALNKTRQLAEGLESLQQRIRRLQEGAKGQQQAGRLGRPSQGEQEGTQPDPNNPQGQQIGRQGQQRGQQGPQGQQSGNAQGMGAQQAQNQQNPSGARPNGDVRGLTANAYGPPIGVGPYSDEDIRQLRREAQQRLNDAQELRRLMDRNSTQWQNLEQVIQGLRRMESSRNYSDPEEAARLRELTDLLRQVELDLNRELAGLLHNDKYFYSDDNEAPASYRKLVEEYYKALAKGKP